MYYHPEILNLGVILLAYYRSKNKIKQLSNLGDCLSVGHYLFTPRALNFGHHFKSNPKFKHLSLKEQKNLTQELSDGTITFKRDHYQPVPPLKSGSNLSKQLSVWPNYKYIYLYQHETWFKVQNSRDHFQFTDLRQAIRHAIKETKKHSDKLNLVLGKVCPNCHYIVPVNEHFCYHCGLDFYHHARCAVIDAGHNHFPTTKQTKKCPNCKQRVSITNRYCNYCGHDFLK